MISKNIKTPKKDNTGPCFIDSVAEFSRATGVPVCGPDDIPKLLEAMNTFGWFASVHALQTQWESIVDTMQGELIVKNT